MCASCRTAQVPRIDLDPLLSSIGEVTAPPSSSSSELSPDQEVPWCGRSSELKALMTLAEQSLNRRQLRCFLVLGTPGLGKSRLLRELGRMIVRHLGVPKTRVLFATVPGEGAAAHSVFAELFHKRFAITAGESAQSARDKVLRTCRSLLPAVRATEVAHLLGDLLELPFPDSPVSSGMMLQPGRTTPRLYSAIKRFLAADARRAPLLLLLDEMEHAGAETMSLMHYLLDGLQDLPVLIGLAARPEFADTYPDFGTSTVVPERLELAALPAEDAIELLGAVVGADPEELPAPLVAHIGTAFDGSPRAVVELVRLLVEIGALSWVPASDPMAAEDDQPLVPEWDSERLDKGELPASFAGLVHARLQAMAAAPRAILEQAAIVGEHFYLGAVRMLARCDATRLGVELTAEPREPSESAESAESAESIEPTELTESAESAEPSDPDGPPLDEVIEASERADEEDELLALLQSQGVVLLLPSSQLRGEREYRFAYPPWQETIYRSIPPAKRRRYHHLVAQWLQLCPERDRQEVQEAIGRHLERASRGPDAARHYRRSAELATARGAYNRAPRLLLRALAKEPAARHRSAAEFSFDLRQVMQELGVNRRLDSLGYGSSPRADLCEALVDACPLAMFVASPSGELLFGNAALGGLLGIPAAELRGKLSSTLLGRWCPRIERDVRMVLARRRPSRHTLVVHNPQGEARGGWLTLAPYRRDGEVVGVCGVVAIMGDDSVGEK